MIYFLLVFFLGAAVGSFVNVLIDRTMIGADWVSGRSHCDACKKPLSWYDMVPVLSFLLYRGRARCCGAPLSWRYPLVELLVGCLFLWWFAVGFWFFQLAERPLQVIQPAFWLLTGIVLAILALSDLFYGVVLMPVLMLGYALTLLYRGILFAYGAYQGHDFIWAVLLSGIFFAFFWILHKATRGRGMADGDMYMAAYMGLLLGWPKGVIGLLSSFVVGAVIGLLLMALRLRGRHDSVPFVPFMVLGVAIALYGGEMIWHALYG